MKVQTSHFGCVEVIKDDIYLFPKGISGFPLHLKHFVFIDDPKNELFLWLQSTEDPNFSLCLLEPELFGHQLEIKISEKERQLMQLQKIQEKPQVLCVITLISELKQLTANLRCPILLNSRNRLGCQVVLPNPRLSLSEPIFNYLKKRLTMNQTEQIKDSLRSHRELNC